MTELSSNWTIAEVIEIMEDHYKNTEKPSSSCSHKQPYKIENPNTICLPSSKVATVPEDMSEEDINFLIKAIRLIKRKNNEIRTATNAPPSA